MISRLIRTTLASVFALSIASYGIAYAGDDDGNPCGGDENPCGGAENPCGGAANPCGGGEGSAEPAAGGETPAEGAAEEGAEGEHMDSLTLPKGGIAVDLLIEMNMSKSAVGKPFSIAPDISYGVSDKLTLTLAHSGYGTTGFAGGVGGGLCLAGTDNGCEKVYNNVGLLALFGLSSSPSMKLAADGGIVIRHISDPMFLDIKVGVLGKWSSGKIGITFNPSVLIGATKRDSGNKESLGVPVTLMYHAAAKLGVGIQTGIAGPFTDFSKLFVVPLSVGANYMVNDHIGVGGAFTVTQITGGSALRDASITGFDGRALNIWLSWMK